MKHKNKTNTYDATFQSHVLKYFDILELRNTKEVEDKLPLGEANFEKKLLVRLKI